MERIVAEVFVPAINKYYDFVLPCFMPIKELSPLIMKTVSEHENIVFNTNNLLLFLNDTGEILKDTLSISQTKVADGCRLTII